MFETYVRIVAERTGKDPEQIRRDCDRDYWMSAEEAVEYGLIDEVIPGKKKLLAS